jgi:hypothetical protein
VTELFFGVTKVNQSVPADFAEEASRAFNVGDRAYLILLSLEVQGMPWEQPGKQLIQNSLDVLAPRPDADRVVLFTGHRIDAPGRSQPRFPADSESVARSAITNMLAAELQQGKVLGVAGGANGGDILFLEACLHFQIPYQMRLALPEDQFIAASVVAPSGNWVERFQTLAEASKPSVLASSETLPAWLNAKRDYNFWERNNLWLISSALALQPAHFILAALWDGKEGDGAGGTENMVRVAQRHGARFIHLDTGELFGAKVTRSEAQ